MMSLSQQNTKKKKKKKKNTFRNLAVSFQLILNLKALRFI